MTSPSTSGPPPDSRSGSGEARTRSRERRALRWGFAVSFALHIVAIVLYPRILERADPGLPARPDVTPEEILPGFEIVTLRERLEGLDEAPLPDPPILELLEEEPPPPSPEPAEPPDPPAVVDEVEPVEGVVPEAEAPAPDLPSIAERLRPGPGDPRLWTYLLPDYSELSDSDRANLLLEGMLQTFNDSIAVAAALAGEARDWTYTDDEGRRWGLSPGRLHLGDFSIPLPISFEIPPGLSNEFARRQWEIDDILRGATAAEIRETWSIRAREIRERMDAERARGQQQGGGG